MAGQSFWRSSVEEKAEAQTSLFEVGLTKRLRRGPSLISSGQCSRDYFLCFSVMEEC